MKKKKTTSFILISIVLLFIVYCFRFQMLFKVQLYQINSIRQDARLSNNSFASDFHQNSRHHVFLLKGIERIMPHRVNSLQRFAYLYDHFEGFECDIIFDSLHSILFLAHDKQEISAYTFESLLKEDKKKKIFWLDVKNMDSTSFLTFYQHLKNLDNNYDLKTRIIIESTNPFFLLALMDSGYLTSLYLTRETEYGDKNFRSYIKKKGRLISQDISQLNMFNKIYPSKKKITWDITFLNSLDKDVLIQHIQDSSILLCLINIKSPGYR